MLLVALPGMKSRRREMPAGAHHEQVEGTASGKFAEGLPDQSAIGVLLLENDVDPVHGEMPGEIRGALPRLPRLLVRDITNSSAAPNEKDASISSLLVGAQ